MKGASRSCSIVFTVATLAGLLCWATLGSREKVSAQTASPSQKETDELEAQARMAFSEYRSWKPVNAEPIVVPPKRRVLCESWTAATLKNPHEDGLINIYVNDKGRKSYLEAKSPKFDEGAVIVKEKLRPGVEKERAQEGSPRELGIMIKRQKGYNPDNGDWQFLLVDAQNRLVSHEKEVFHCGKCHQIKADSDFVYRKLQSK
jgi:hypothetical protein